MKNFPFLFALLPLFSPALSNAAPVVDGDQIVQRIQHYLPRGSTTGQDGAGSCTIELIGSGQVGTDNLTIRLTNSSGFQASVTVLEGGRYPQIIQNGGDGLNRWIWQIPDADGAPMSLSLLGYTDDFTASVIRIKSIEGDRAVNVACASDLSAR